MSHPRATAGSMTGQRHLAGVDAQVVGELHLVIEALPAACEHAHERPPGGGDGSPARRLPPIRHLRRGVFPIGLPGTIAGTSPLIPITGFLVKIDDIHVGACLTVPLRQHLSFRKKDEDLG